MNMKKDFRYRITHDSQRDWNRNIVSLRKSIDLFAELIDDPCDAQVLIQHELAVKRATREPAILRRPFEDAETYDAIAAAINWPFEHPCRSRYSSGTFGVWYGAESVETSVRETVYHFRRNTLGAAIAAQSEIPIVQERRVHLVRCSAMLVDLRTLTKQEPRLVHPEDYTACQSLGAELKGAGMPGVLTLSARHDAAQIVGVFTPEVLTDPRTVCYLTYTLYTDSGKVLVERTPGKIEYELAS